ncbi:Rossmann-fold NAD(P)-binding domain-containing protein [Virgibacillus senegalensis]|uniref:hypothetical protein n=1 Tax=Virgibacillus senegalensis TaxID=1499679 RepID=UPI00069EDAC1|nr:hypothetical protein [Virgibacillus senegalensis]
MEKKHALVIGGTGMLAQVSSWLASNFDTVSVIGRSEKKLDRLKKKAQDMNRINKLVVDYYELATLETKLKKAIEEHGPITLVVCWSPYYPAVEMVSRLISEKMDSWQLYHVKGSRRYFEDEAIRLPPACRYRQIYLGFVLTKDKARWLTHDEITDGVRKSIEKEEDTVVVGTIHPYDKRPQ